MKFIDNKERICGLYLRVNTENQARECFSLGEQKERLETLCKFKDYKIYDYYQDAGISAKTGKQKSLELKQNSKEIKDTIDTLKISKLNKDNYILSTLSIKLIIQIRNMIKYKLYLILWLILTNN